jgi:uncharacterized protein involved in response to NO
MLARDGRGPAVLSSGFRPFFLLGAICAALVIAIWFPWYLGFISVPALFPPVAWHAHELLFGYVPAVAAGFLLTAVPNWTRRPPVVGWPLAGLVLVWLAGRVAVAISDELGPRLTALATMALLVALAALIGREIVAARNWKNLKVPAILIVLLADQALFQWEIWRYGRNTYGASIAVATILVLIMLIGGRIVPSFTGNWLRKRGVPGSPAAFSRVDALVSVVCTVALAAWVGAPALPEARRAIGVLLVLASAVQLLRQVRWCPHRTLREPLVAILHVAYFFVPIGFLLTGLSFITDSVAPSAGIHAWTAGAIGVMTLAMMTRVTLGHTGRPLRAGWGTTGIYGLVVVSAIARIVVALVPEWTMMLVPASGLAWCSGFIGFALLFGPALVGGMPPLKIGWKRVPRA